VGTWFRATRKFEREPFALLLDFSNIERIKSDAEFTMQIDIDDDDEANAKKFRDYAAQCRRLARTASEQDRAVLIEIAEAWTVCAEQAEGNARSNRGG
jgi:hypothetical protein